MSGAEILVIAGHEDTVEAVSCSREKESERRGIARRNLIDKSAQKFCGARESGNPWFVEVSWWDEHGQEELNLVTCE
jgi:hypothetical protein